MSYEKQNWVPYDDNLSEEENINVGAVVTAERMNHLESGIQQHTNDEENPHKVTKAQVGLSNVTDVEQASKVDFEAHATNNLNPHGVTAAQVGLNNVENIRQAAKTDFDAHVENSANPHGVTAKQVGLENVMNYGIAGDDEAASGESDEKYMTPAKTKRAIESLIPKPYKILFNGNTRFADGEVTLSESVNKFNLIMVTISINGNLVTSTYVREPSTNTWDITMGGTNLGDGDTSTYLGALEMSITFSGAKITWKRSKEMTVDTKGITIPSVALAISNVIGWY